MNIMAYPTVLLALAGLAILGTATAQRQAPAGAGSQEEFLMPLAEQQHLRTMSATTASMGDVDDVFARIGPLQTVIIGELTPEDVNQEPNDPREKVGVVKPLIPPLIAADFGNGLAPAFAQIDHWRDGTLVWTSKIMSRRATGLRIHIRDANLPTGSKLFVTDGTRYVYGPYNDMPTPFWTDTVFAESIYIQVQIPRDGINRGENHLEIDAVGYMFGPGISSGRATPSDLDGIAIPGGPPARRFLGERANCGLIDFCRPSVPIPNPTPEQTMLQAASLGVAHIVFEDGGKFWVCSGGLLRDSNADSKPFFLTAHHCFSSQSAASSVEVYFRYQNVCNEPPPSLGDVPRVSGSYLIATSSGSDFTFLQLREQAPQGSYFFPWTPEDLSGSDVTVYRVHHPDSDNQQYQMSRLDPSPSLVCYGLPLGNFLYSDLNKGGTSGGSSGSLLFRANGSEPVVIGQLFGACFSNTQACGYFNVDGAFSRTYQKIKQYIGPNG